MANATRTVRVRFDGTAAGLSRAAKQAEKDLERVRNKASSFRDGTIKFGAITGLVGALGSLGGPVVAGGVAAVGALGFAGATAALAFSGTGDAVEEFNKALESGDYSEYEKKLAKLPKSQQEMVRELVKTKEEFKKLKTTAADNALPGITRAIAASRDLLPTLDGAVARSGKIISGVGDDFAKLFKQEQFKKDLDAFAKAGEPVTRSLGKLFVNLTADLVGFGAQMRPAGEGFAEFIDSLSSGLGGFFDELGPHAEDFKVIWQSLGDIVEEVLPIAGRFFGEASATWAPILRETADFLGQNSDAISDFAGGVARATPYLLGLAIAIKGVKTAGAVMDFAQTVGRLRGLGTEADNAGRKFGGLKTLLKAGLVIGAVVGGVNFFRGLAGDIDSADAAWKRFDANKDNQWDPSETWNAFANFDFEAIGNRVRKVFEVEPNKMFHSDVLDNTISSLSNKWRGFINSINGIRPSPVKIEADGSIAHADLANFIGEVNGSSGSVNINGNEQPAGTALQGVIAAIQRGEGSVTINGVSVPAGTALQTIVDQINATQGTVDINGNPVPAGDALRSAIEKTNGSTGVIGIAAKDRGAAAATNNTRSFMDRALGVLGIGARDRGAAAATRGAVGSINGSKGSVGIGGNAGGAFSALGAFLRAIPSFVTIGIRAITGGAGGGAVGAVAGVRGYKRGGPIFGPGTGTSDSIPALAGRTPIRVANNEHIVTEREVRAAGGHGAVYAIRRAMLDGRLRRFLAGPGYASGGAVGAAKEILARIRSRQQLFEDWSWRGNSAAVSQWNDFLLDARKKAGIKDPVAFLEKYIRDAERQQASVRTSSAAAPARASDADRIIAAISRLHAGASSAALPPNVEVKVYVDGQELRGMVRTEIADSNAATRRLVGSGTGRGW